jgi:hypothetical protein
VWAKNKVVRNVSLVLLSLAFLASNIACEAFARKFSRKPKKQGFYKQEAVVAPENYEPPEMTNEDLYRQYFLYWRSWHDELLDSLASAGNRKKQLSCFDEAINNLQEMYGILSGEKKGKLASYIAGLEKIRQSVLQDTYADRAAGNFRSAAVIKKDILREFSYNKVKDSLSSR